MATITPSTGRGWDTMAPPAAAAPAATPMRTAVRARGWGTRVATMTAAQPAQSPTDATDRTAGLRGSRAAASLGPAARGRVGHTALQAQGTRRERRPASALVGSLPWGWLGALRMSAAGTLAEARDD